VHDETEFKFPTKREGLGFLSGSKEAGDGFYGHFSLAVSYPLMRPLGMIEAQVRVKDKVKGYLSPAKKREDKTRKTLSWGKGIEAAEQRLKCPKKLIHVADREADFYELLWELNDKQRHYVIRVNHQDRKVCDKSQIQNLSEQLESQREAIQLKREVRISKKNQKVLPKDRKRNPARQARTAHLCISASSVKILRGHHHGARLAKSIELNVVHVFEPAPPQGEQAIDWKLYTSEPIDCPQQIAKVVDIYRGRWLIEEYFKALKTGCAFEERQLESKHTITNALAIFIPVAWQLLLLRSETRTRPHSLATIVLSQTQIAVLKAVSKLRLPQTLTVQDAMLAIARMGGHIKQNGPPGWQTLNHGLTQLLTLEQGWLAAKRCDQ
jgi:transposase